ncbi:hypothetical protein F52700_4071 [Fusarium sp. NRRL 52700]|nr:hypothetical protein F52700_4071 [Fusarium sp. NRRL 52700]
MADKSTNNTGNRRLKRSLPTDSSYSEQIIIVSVMNREIFTFNPAILNAVEAKKRRVGDALHNIFERLPEVLDWSETWKPPPGQTGAGPSSRQKQLALPPPDPRETAGEQSGRAGG